ncbi:MAG: DUF2179 domain-containing protein [Flexilinea sp.]|nr:DUF2179 domain-containing protein [Flexilinea sp.]
MTEFFNTLTPDILVGGFVIFLLRLIDMSLDTLRVLFVMRGQRVIVWILGVTTSIIYVVAISNVLTGAKHPFTILCYGVGYATGNVLGMRIEERLAIGFMQVNVVSQNKGREIASALRDRGYGVTQLKGEGMNGTVDLVSTSVKRKQAKDVRKIIEKIDEKAFITEDSFNPVKSGTWRK